MAPLADACIIVPKQIEVDVGVTETDGIGFTFIVITPGDVLTQPNPLEPETEYVVVTDGQTIGPPFRNVYDVAPLGVRVTQVPAQIVFELAVTPIVGRGLTITITVRVPLQPKAEVPVTV